MSVDEMFVDELSWKYDINICSKKISGTPHWTQWTGTTQMQSLSQSTGSETIPYSLPDFPVTTIIISSYIKDHVHWLPISTRIEYKVLLIVLKAQMGVAPKYLRDAIRLTISVSSLRPLRSMDRRELFVPRTRTTMAMSRTFSVIGPSLWNRLPPSARASLLSSNLSMSISLLKTCLFSWS